MRCAILFIFHFCLISEMLKDVRINTTCATPGQLQDHNNKLFYELDISNARIG